MTKPGLGPYREQAEPSESQEPSSPDFFDSVFFELMRLTPSTRRLMIRELDLREGRLIQQVDPVLFYVPYTTTMQVQSQQAPPVEHVPIWLGLEDVTSWAMTHRVEGDRYSDGTEPPVLVEFMSAAESRWYTLGAPCRSPHEPRPVWWFRITGVPPLRPRDLWIVQVSVACPMYMALRVLVEYRVTEAT